jgi:hypothetical protein
MESKISNKIMDIWKKILRSVHKVDSREEDKRRFEKFIKDTATDRRGLHQKEDPNNQKGEDAKDE